MKVARKRSDPISVYADIKPYLDTALRYEEPARVKFSILSQCYTWRARAHRFRAALRAVEEREFTLPAGKGSCKYDDLVINIDEAETSITIRRRTAEGIMSIGGEEVTPVIDELLDGFDLNLEDPS